MHATFLDRINEGQYCAYDPVSETTACLDDSGGPLQMLDNSKVTRIVFSIWSRLGR